MKTILVWTVLSLILSTLVLNLILVYLVNDRPEPRRPGLYNSTVWVINV